MANFTSAHTGNEIDLSIASGSTTTGVIKDFNTLSGSSTSTINVGGAINTLSHITASGNISASGTIFASKFESAGTSGETISFNDNLNITGNITASGNISASGGLSIRTNSSFDNQLAVGTQLSVTGTSHLNGDVNLGNALTDDVNVKGHMTASGNISSSGTITAAAIVGTTIDATTDFTIDGLVITADTITNDASLRIETSAGDITLDAAGKDINFTDGAGTAEFAFNLEDAPELDVDGDFTIDGSGLIKLDSATNNINLVGNVTASGNISSSGIITANAINVNGTDVLTSVSGNTFATDLKIGRDADNLIDFTTDNQLLFRVGASNELKMNTSTLFAGANDGLSLGATAIGFSDLFLADGAVIGFNNGEIHLTHTDAALVMSGSGATKFQVEGNINTTSHITASGNISSSGTITAAAAVLTTADINGGTVDGITSLTAGGNLDIGSHGFRAATITADGLTATRVPFAGTAGLLSDDSDLTFATATLSATNLTTTGTIKDFGLVSGSVVSTGSFGAGFFDGNVGIGTTSPTLGKLHISGSGTNANYASLLQTRGSVTYQKFANSSTGVASGDGFDIGASGTTAYLINRESSNMIFSTSDTERIRIEAGGDVGIGTVNPTKKLTVAGDISASGAINTLSHITASGNVSSSGTITANDVSFNNLPVSQSGLTVGQLYTLSGSQLPFSGSTNPQISTKKFVLIA